MDLYMNHDGCCRFVELLWQLSAHALREVHKRSFPADVSANPLPTSLTEVAQCNHASALLTVTKVHHKRLFRRKKIMSHDNY